MLHVPSVNHPCFNQYLLHKLKEKLIEAVTLVTKKKKYLHKPQEKNNAFAQAQAEHLSLEY